MATIVENIALSLSLDAEAIQVLLDAIKALTARVEALENGRN